MSYREYIPDSGILWADMCDPNGPLPNPKYYTERQLLIESILSSSEKKNIGPLPIPKHVIIKFVKVK